MDTSGLCAEHLEAALALIQTIKEKSKANYMVLDKADVQQLQEALGTIKDGKELVAKVKRLGTIRVQGRSYQLTPGQMARLKQSAFFYVKSGEPRSESEATKEQAQAIIDRYVNEQLDLAMSRMVGEL